MKTKIEIKSIFGNLLFEYETENNTIKKTLEAAISSSANLRYADLSSADLSSANLRYANLRYANLSSADLRYADLSSADLSSANLSYANLSSADLSSANLSYADLSSADLEKDKFPIHKYNFLPEGELIGWKVVNGVIIKLLIPREAKRVHCISSRKCRAEFAVVVDVENDAKEILNTSYSHYVLYKVGETVKPDGFNDCWLTECGNGINFFINKQEAVEY